MAAVIRWTCGRRVEVAVKRGKRNSCTNKKQTLPGARRKSFPLSRRGRSCGTMHKQVINQRAKDTLLTE